MDNNSDRCILYISLTLCLLNMENTGVGLLKLSSGNEIHFSSKFASHFYFVKIVTLKRTLFLWYVLAL